MTITCQSHDDHMTITTLLAWMIHVNGGDEFTHCNLPCPEEDLVEVNELVMFTKEVV